MVKRKYYQIKLFGLNYCRIQWLPPKKFYLLKFPEKCTVLNVKFSSLKNLLLEEKKFFKTQSDITVIFRTHKHVFGIPNLVFHLTILMFTN